MNIVTKSKMTQKKLPHLLEPIVKSRAFRALWIGNTLSTLGSSITLIIFPMIVYSLSHSTLSMGFVMAGYMLPNVVILPFSGMIVDRLNRVRLMRAADIVRAVLTCLGMILGLLGYLTIPLLIAIAAMIGLMNGLFDPAFAALRATIFTSDIRTGATSLSQASVQLMRLLGPALGGIIVSVFSAPIGFGVDAATYVISLICLLFLTKEGQVHKTFTSSKESFIRECFAGISILSKHTWLWITILDLSLLNICRSGITAILIPWLVKFHFDFPIYVYGLIMSSEGIGGTLAAFVYGMRKRWQHRGLIAYTGIGLGGCALFLVALIPNGFALMLLMLIEGAGIMVFGLIWEISLQELVKNESFGRVASLDMIGSFALMPVGYMLTGWIAQAIGGTVSMLILSGTLVISTAAVLLIPQIRHFD
ncbi:MFS transporter [Sporolactobacillus pectinivorans]|uniref:MFS transporter n=1 Tax=Sporolactobacillus pectinivorans TaxID=1591408 RepID=UPI000C2568A5|nr:MFS transporter [Sporolactobacillus pectinivorans]